MKCDKCGHALFKINTIESCPGCEHNGAWDPDEEEYTNDEAIISEKDLMRNQAFDDGECAMGSALGEGCEMIICARCGWSTHIPIGD